MSAATALPILYDPRKDGARCDECCLGPNSPFIREVEIAEAAMESKKKRRDAENATVSRWRPVRAEMNPGAGALVVGEAPGEEEEEHGRPFIGKSGIELTHALNATGFPRGCFAITNAICCRPPRNQLERLRARLKRHNKREEKKVAKAVAQGETYTPRFMLDPVEACAPRLAAEARNFTNLLLVGGTALKAFLGDHASPMGLRGTPMVLELTAEGRVYRSGTTGGAPEGTQIVHRWATLSTVHSAFALRMRRWLPMFRQDVAKALRYFTGKLNWRAPAVVINPRPEEVERFLEGEARAGRPVTYDCESLPAGSRVNKEGKVVAYYEASRDRMAIFAVGNKHVAYVVQFLGRDGKTTFYTDIDAERMRGVLRKYMTDPRMVKRGWNHGSYDRQLVEQPRHLGVTPSPIGDGILMHRLVHTEYRHSLGFALSHLTDAPTHKEDDIATNPESDYAWCLYAGHDVAAEHECIDILEPQVFARGQGQLLIPDHAVQNACVGMHQNGMLIDQRVRGELEAKFSRQAGERLEALRDLIQRRAFNPRSHDQVSELLYDDWNLPIYKYSDKTGAPSTDDDCIIQLFTWAELSSLQRRALRLIRKVRKANKSLEVVLACRLERDGGYAWNSDGRIRTTYNAHGTVGGRTSSSDPINLQNVDHELRVMFVPGAGMVFVGADYAALEARIVAAIAQAINLLGIFRNGFDLHGFTAESAFGQLYRDAPGYVHYTKGTPVEGSVAYDMRVSAKRIFFGWIYGAGLETIHKQITEAEDEEGELTNYDADPRETAIVVNALAEEVAPEIPQWWDKQIELWRQFGFVWEPVLGRRRDCLDSVWGGEELSEMANFSVQAAGASLKNLSLVEFVEKCPFGFAGPGTGVVAETHDHIMGEVPEPEAEKWRRELEGTMTKTVDTLPGVVFKAKGKIGKNWAEA